LNILLGFLFLAISGVVYVLMRDLPLGTLEEGMGPAFFPGCLLIVLAGLSLILIFTEAYAKVKGRRAVNGETGKSQSHPFRGAQLRLPMLLTLTVGVYLTLLKALGFLTLTPFLIFVVMLFFRSSAWNAALAALALTAGIYLIFGIGFQIPFPRGSVWGY
jgi:putative tricarboxylic transport membrane protein